ncbi:MAG: tRNA 5-methoxyuridine(34)/uridine 5-oxyacetic acid(34) synthase CmoB, partial [Thiothrix sp.]
DLSVFLQNSRLTAWLNTLPTQLQATLQQTHGHWQNWQAAIINAPDLQASSYDFTGGAIRIGEPDDADNAARTQLQHCLQALIPWRKGPYKLFGITVDTEWRSDWKWQRIAPHLSDLRGRVVLDVGCGSGYHLWRMYGAGAAAAIGIDPTLLFFSQFQLIKRYVPNAPVWMLPLKSEDLPDLHQKGFDTVFSMGVLYHRRDPLGPLQELRRALRAGGELVLETLVIVGDVNTVLMPENRYAKMRNVWFLPSTAALKRWLKRLGFVNVRVVDVNQTSLEEQRCTLWSKGESLVDFLDATDRSRTIEGYPAPLRATLIASVPARSGQGNIAKLQ